MGYGKRDEEKWEKGYKNVDENDASRGVQATASRTENRRGCGENSPC
jgi:hypothetical protein